MKLAIILGATRPGRHTARVAEWVSEEAKNKGANVELLDLLDYPLPFFNETVSPRYNADRTLSDEAKKWLTKLEEFEAFVVVTPEYNHSVPGVLKNAFDYVDWQLNRKPSAIVSHGTVGGARAAMHPQRYLQSSGTE